MKGCVCNLRVFSFLQDGLHRSPERRHRVETVVDVAIEAPLHDARERPWQHNT